MCKKSLLIVVAVIGLSCLAYAQSYLGPQVGWYRATDADNGKAMIGGAFRTMLSPSFGLEGSINYREEDYDHGNITVTSWPVMVTALIYPIKIAYGAIGAGWYNTSIKYNHSLLDLDSYSATEQKFGWHFGGGVQIPLSQNTDNPSTVLTGDVRYVFLNYDFKKLPGTDGLKSNFVVFTVGLLFNLE